MNLEHSVA